ncbi:MAG: oleate hydratase [Candidatus Fimimorpha sp.]
MKAGTLIKTGLAITAAAAITKTVLEKKTEKEAQQQAAKKEVAERDYADRRAYFVGGGLASMAGAAYLIRDAKFPANQITIYEGTSIIGGSNDGIGTPKGGFVCRGGRMLNEETYENFWELFDSIPSLEFPGKSVTEEILNFDHAHPTHAKARLVDRNGNILNVKTMGFRMKDRLLLLKLMKTSEEELDDMTIEEWFENDPHFFETNFWYIWQTTFAFQKWSSLFEFRRYMNRMIFEFSRIETLEGVTRTRFNQYDSIIRPLEQYLTEQGVIIKKNSIVKDIDFTEDIITTAKTIHLEKNGIPVAIELHQDDLCFVTNGCMTDSATLGDLHHAAPEPTKEPISALLWKKIASKRSNLGNPDPFFGNKKQSNWESFTVTMKGDHLLKMIENFSGNVPGNGALMTFRDSSWLMSIVVAAQPHFVNQEANQTIFWGYALYTDVPGNYIRKPMKDCTGEEILTEFLYHIHMLNKKEEIMNDVINVIPCMMPYIDAQFQPRKMSDRPYVVPDGSTNFAMISQFVEIPDDMVFTEEYSVRAARIAVYELLKIHKEICPVTPYNRRPSVLAKAVYTSFRKQ